MVYEYKCENCNREFELSCKVSDRDKAVNEPCTICGGVIRRLISSTNFHLHGHGWARDGYQSAVGKMLTRSEAQRDAEKR